MVYANDVGAEHSPGEVKDIVRSSQFSGTLRSLRYYCIIDLLARRFEQDNSDLSFNSWG
jgi:hypothetical protein